MKPITAKIWQEFGDNIRRFIHARISNPEAVDDVLQDVFIKIHSNIDSLADTEKIQPWLFRIARNAIMDYYRKKKITTEITDDVLKTEEHFDSEPQQEIEDGLRGMIDNLPEVYRQALLLTEYGGITQKELSKQMGISLSGAKSRVQRARQKLRDELMRCCHFELDHYGKIIDYHPITCCCCHPEENG